MWWWWWRRETGKQQKCVGGVGGVKTIEMWLWWRENNRSMGVVYSFTIHEAVLKKKRVQGRRRVDEGFYGVVVKVEGRI